MKSSTVRSSGHVARMAETYIWTRILKAWRHKTTLSCLFVDGKIILQEALGRTDSPLRFNYILSIWYETDSTENTASNTSSIAACVFVEAGKCLPSSCPATAVSSGSTIQVFRSSHRHTVRLSHKPPLYPTFLIFKNKRRLMTSTCCLCIPLCLSVCLCILLIF
jgi:hypothetical protein